MNAPHAPALQMHLILNVLNRFSLTPGFEPRDHEGIESLANYLVAVHRLQSAPPGVPLDKLRQAIETYLALSQWLREEAPPTVEVHSPLQTLRSDASDLAARIQLALRDLDGWPLSHVSVSLASAPDALVLQVLLEVTGAAHAVPPSSLEARTSWRAAAEAGCMKTEFSANGQLA
ncbi:MAG: hypothetical protein JWP52_1203 [Rhizobacter sp.]|nr:hypothetical protein [Rhizobacter sp.]